MYLSAFIFSNDDMEFDFLNRRKKHTNGKIITSDDVFDYILNIRNLNEGNECL
ncbi:hypothetical protein [Clostridium aceticum]|uniref:hypothetical protein n=1 Tax=Clostridium aceticum TaxID=84022 RepID=UPI001FA72FF3|nr:hypothetical protein [Clostridium aceticum]